MIAPLLSPLARPIQGKPAASPITGQPSTDEAALLDAFRRYRAAMPEQAGAVVDQLLTTFGTKPDTDQPAPDATDPKE
jgi:hypothetical protein